MDTKIRDVRVDADTKARLENKAFLERTSVSELVRTILEGIAAGEYDDVKEKNPPSQERARIGLLVEDDLWQAADDAAWRQRLSKSAFIRLVADHLYGDLPTDRGKVVRK